jgi:proline iminopeptidase
VVLHGGPGAHHDYLLPQMLALGERHELLFYDQRGGGRSRTDDPAPITWRTHVEDLTQLLVEFEIETPAIVGYSWGGFLSLLYLLAGRGLGPGGEVPAVHQAPRLLALVDPAPASSKFRREFEEEFARRQGSEEVKRLRADLLSSGLRERDPAAFRQRQFELAVAGYFHDLTLLSGLTAFRVTGKVQQSVWESLGEFDLIPLLRDAGVPSLVVHGREDPIPLASSRAVAESLGARLEVIERCGHVPYVEKPDVLFPMLLDFLANTDTMDQ